MLRRDVAPHPIRAPQQTRNVAPVSIRSPRPGSSVPVRVSPATCITSAPRRHFSTEKRSVPIDDPPARRGSLKYSQPCNEDPADETRRLETVLEMQDDGFGKLVNPQGATTRAKASSDVEVELRRLAFGN